MRPTFILGAGFNADAATEARAQLPDYGYPLVGDTLRLCFGIPEAPPGKSIEDLFSEAFEAQNWEPIRQLARCLRHADIHVAFALARAEEKNYYQQFFDTFRESRFLTFNYDSLPETILFRRKHWLPADGYGVRVTAHLRPGYEELAARTSSALVLHLHGSLSIRTSEYQTRPGPPEVISWREKRAEPLYFFDPHSVSPNFEAFARDRGANEVEDRIIAPVPDKSHRLKESFIKDTYAKAVDILRESKTVVAIGYSFNRHDFGSYQPLLEALRTSKGSRLLLVSPDADTAVKVIRAGFPDISPEPLKATFRQWVAASFRGLDPNESRTK